MERYSMFSSSTNSSSSPRSSPSSNFPFSISQVPSTSNSLSYVDHHTYDHDHNHNHDHDHYVNQSRPLINGLIMMGGGDKQQLIDEQPPMGFQSTNHLMNNNDYQNDYGSQINNVIAPYNGIIHRQDSKDDQSKRINSVNDNKLVKKGSLEKKKVKKHRYAFQTRSHVDILDDGYRWRKYGQKAVKNNKFPRSYYKCTYQGCNVKKQVQRLSNDEGVVITTYEGAHSHSIERSTDNFEHILSQMQIYTPI